MEMAHAIRASRLTLEQKAKNLVGLISQYEFDMKEGARIAHQSKQGLN